MREPIIYKTLIKHGNSLALVIDKPILELLQITAETPLELTANGDATRDTINWWTFRILSI